MNDRKIERSDGHDFDRQQLLAYSIENFISHEKKSDSTRPDIYKAFKPFWLSNWVSIARVVARFPQASLSRPAATAADLETPCVCARPSDPPKLCRSAAQRAWPLILQSKLRLSSGIAFGSDCQMTRRGLNLDSNLNSAAWPMGCRVLSAQRLWNPRIKFNKLCGVWILLRTPKLRTAVSQYQPSSTRLGSLSSSSALQFSQSSECGLAKSQWWVEILRRIRP